MKNKLLFFLLFFAAGLYAQVREEPGGFRHITVKDGLPSSEVYCVLQDSKGYIWMSTDAGVCRYNGYSFEVFTTRDGLCDNTNFMLREDSKGRIWAAGLSGSLSYCDSLGFHGIPANDSLKKLLASGQHFLHSFSFDQQNRISLGGFSTNACYRLFPEEGYAHLHQIKEPYLPDYWRSCWSDKNGQVMAYSMDSLINKKAIVFHNGHSSVINLEGKDSQISTNSRVLLTKGNRLVYSYSRLLITIDSSGKSNEYLFDSPIVGLDEDKKGNIWISFYHDGTWLCPEGKIEEAYQVFFGGKTVSCVLQDREDGYWFSIVGDGVYYLPDLDFGYLAPGNGLPFPAVMALQPMSRERIFMGLAGNTVCIFNPKAKDNNRLLYRTLEPASNYPIEAVFIRGDTIIVSNQGMIYLDTNLVFQKLINWRQFGHSKGVAVNPKTGLSFFFSHANMIWFNDTLLPDSIRTTSIRFTAACYGSDGTLWLGAVNGLWKMEKGQLVHKGDSLNGIPGRIDQICEDRNGILWIATRGEGVYAWDGLQRWHFGERDGLSSNTCRAVSVDEKNRVWVGTNRGVTMIRSFDKKSGKAELRQFNSTNGLLSDEITHVLCYDGKLWLGSNDGLCWIETDRLLKTLPPPPVYITSILFGNHELSAAQAVELDYSDNTIRVFVEGLSYHDPERLRYRYRLIGGSGDWITTENREIMFAGLAPGDYSLEILAVNSDGISSLQPAVFNFHIIAPFWMTWWFIAGSVVLLLLVVWFIANDRFRRQRRRAHERAATERRMVELRLSALRAQMNPHFIFNAINSIQHFVLRNEGDQAYHYLSRFSRLIRMVLDQSQAELVTISQELEMMKLYIELEMLRFERPFEYIAEVDPELLEENVRIPGMLIQPFVENAIWHGLLPKKEGAAIVQLRIRRKGEGVHILIEDNGVGRSKAAEQKTPGDSQRRSYGLKITEERLALGEKQTSGNPLITITDLLDDEGKPAGTRVEIFVNKTPDM